MPRCKSFFNLSFLKFFEVLNYIDRCLLSHWGSFQPLFLQMFFLLLFLFSLLGLPFCIHWFSGMVSHRSFRHCSFFFICVCFFSCPSDWIISIDPYSCSWFFFPAGSSVVLKFSSKFLISGTVLFSSRISVWFLSFNWYSLFFHIAFSWRLLVLYPCFL